MHDPVCVDYTICPFGTNILKLDNLKNSFIVHEFYLFLLGWLPTSRTVGTGFQGGLINQSGRVELGILDFKMNLLGFPNWKHIQKAVLWMEGSW